ncbi:hypothetical protein [Altericroceibacterium xinjiangense]|uniref:hypothetical protein n=1 Tax=Altericroceibacterium xinjiangense TaxID=762261 RepID=UPI000F7F92C2|nr:hypothetical protein [Altericroceibacterium xinjiangense]
MAVAFVCAVLCTALAPPMPVATEQAAAQGLDVAFEEMAQDRTETAIARLEGAAEPHASEPALLINLGTAYAREGRTLDAERMYRAAITSEKRYDVELADGRWVDSRSAAKLALEHLDRAKEFAMR